MQTRTAVGYLRNANGFYAEKYYFEGSPDKIATFILQNSEAAFSIIITDTGDDFICLASSHKVLEYVDDEVYEKIVAEIVQQERNGFTPISFFEEEVRIMIEVE